MAEERRGKKERLQLSSGGEGFRANVASEMHMPIVDSAGRMMIEVASRG
eukprot:CAMPEP_0202115634 /NCGR_PEP_ID=MMETSP0965-20130614/38826_1 /ASSEMBLY_ACC=CAM_ASM_000507 /TAXON_ID=4773 /ORGANISM="Schizochytrium aggregatum, Strain ATCC28209" /LENGTH=48 /DNA_ID= /DNA_START= /DNA_END= /DNA_ORIENTATION=